MLGANQGHRVCRMTGKRLMPRLAMAVPVRVSALSHTWLDAITVDIGPAGVGLRSAHDLRGRREYRLQVQLPETTLELQGDVVWCAEDADAREWRCGLRLVAAPERWFQLWLKWMESVP